jgi:CRISPR-associated protein Cas1
MIPARMLNEYSYCPRLFYFMHVEGLFRDSTDTIRGRMRHKRAEKNQPKIRRKKGQGQAPTLPDASFGTSRLEQAEEYEKQEQLFTKELSLTSRKLGITGKLDAVEEEEKHYAPVESKNSSGTNGKKEFEYCGKKLSADAWPNDQIQLCAQGLLIRDNNIDSEYGYIYYRGSKKRVKLCFTNDLIHATLDVINKASECAKQNTPPLPLVDSNKCIRCSLNALCLPDEINMLAGKIGEPRRIIPGRDDAGVLYVLTQGVTVAKSGEALVIENKGEKVDEVPLKDIAHVVLAGHVQISTEALHLLLSSQRVVSFLSAGGRLIGTASAPIAKNVTLRVAQYRAFDDVQKCLLLSRSIVETKIANQRIFIRRNAENSEKQLEQLSGLIDNCSKTDNIAGIRGLEGKAGQIYFEILPRLIRPKEIISSSQQTFDDLLGNENNEGFFRFNGRNKRPPKDPVNAMLSFGYTLLARDFLSALVGTGLDPYFGFYHVTELGRPALALDMMEPFRVLIVDSIVCRIVNTGEIKQKHFLCAKTEVMLNKEGKSVFIGAYERRMDELITHPVFGYKISYRRILDVECRLLGRFLIGEISQYKPLQTR